VEQYGRVPGFEVLDALRFLTGEHPSTFIYAVWRDDAVLFGATPERLVRVHGEHVETSVLAGSAGFGAGGRDAAGAAAALRTNAKDILEHDIVRRDIEAQLGAVCEDLRVGTPDVVTLRDIVHLHTPVEARLREGTSILDVVERLHPTPAVGGAPRDAALRFIREQEGLDRGWYAAPVGWMNAQGGEFAVALRCALVRGAGELAHVFAGCGIVEQSDADAEYEEASLKMQTAMSALRAGMIGSVARSPRARRA
jgi:salicylate biosynthesis isochorismate synthase